MTNHQQSAANAGRGWHRVQQWSIGVALLLVVLGIGFRIAPMLDHGQRMLWQWPTEDSYLMMTIARNIALGHGMSVSAGEIATNGTQPLTTLIWAGIFWLAGGDRTSGVLLIQCFLTVLGLVAALLIFLLGRRLLRDKPWGQSVPALAAALWFASPAVINHAMNGLETLVYLVLMVLSVLAWSAWQAQPAAHIRFLGATGVGVLLGLTFLARIDTVFLIAALTSWHCLLALKHRFLLRTGESFVMGATSVVVGSPWLIYNYTAFGSIMPISGTAESAAAHIGSNLSRVPTVLFDYMTQVLPIPANFADRPAVVLVASVVCVAYFALLGLSLRHASRETRAMALVVTSMGLGLAAYYGVFFGARHFVSRYMAPWSPFLALATIGLLFAMLSRLERQPKLQKLAWAGACAAIILLTAGLNARIYLNTGRGSAHDHLQVKQWVDTNVPEKAWIGAVQSGVLGFFHDRTINLDGKVNPYALAAQFEQRIAAYIVETPIEYLADWQGIAEWIEREPLLRKNFELLVDDRQGDAFFSRESLQRRQRLGELRFAQVLALHGGNHPFEVDQ